MKKFILSLLVLVPALCYTQGEDVSIPFNIVYTADGIPRIILDYEIKSVKLKLFYDTGSAGNDLTYEKAEQIGLGISDEKGYTYQFGGGLFFKHQTKNFHNDPIFGAFTSATPTDSLAKFLQLPTGVADGLVGFTHIQHEKCVEIDFQTQRLSFLDTLPRFYLENSLVRRVPMVRQDTLYEAKDSDLFSKQSFCIPGTYRFADSIELRTNFILDLGTPTYTMVYALDPQLLDRILKHKAATVEKYGNYHPTVGLRIPELSIDTMMTNVMTYAEFQGGEMYRAGFGSARVGGFLGIEFFMRYDKILFDEKNRTAYFYKR